MADAGGDGEWRRDWLSARQLTQGLEDTLEQDDDPGLGFNVHQRHGFQYEEEECYGYTDSELDSLRDSQSSSSTPSDDEAIDNKYRERFRSVEGYERRTTSNEISTELQEYPPWFINQPFQYSGKILLISVPGLLLMLSLGGDMFITIATLGSLGMYLFHTSGYHGRTLTCYMVTFVCLQLTIVYSVVPLLWKAWLNLILVVCVNLFSCLTGAWLLLSFESFRRYDPHLTLVIETLLFTWYPTLAVVIVTFLLTTVTSVMAAPYCFLIIGYPVCQSFLIPTTSSFKKVEQGRPEESLIIQPLEITKGVFIYSNSAPILFIMCAFGTQQLYSITAGVELMFLICLGALLPSCFDLEQFIQERGISVKHIRHVMVACGGVVMVATPVVLRRHGVQSAMLPWLPVAMLLHALLIYLLHTKKTKTAIYGCCGAMLCFYLIVFAQLPWGSDSLSDIIPPYVLYIALLCDVLLSLMCVFCYVSTSQQAFGCAVLIQTLGLVISLKLLEASQLLNFIMSVCIAAVAVYLLLRLYYSDKIPMHHSMFAIALHITTALTNLPQFSVTASTSGASDIWWAIIEFIMLFMLEVAMCRIMVFQQEIDVSLKTNFLKVLGETGLLAVLNAPLWLTRLLTSVTREEPALAEYLATILVLEAIVSSKLYFTCICEWNSAKYVGPGLFMSAIIITVIEPQFAWSWENMLKWMLLVSLFTCIAITIMVTHLRKSMFTLIAMATVAGFPLGFALSSLAFPDIFITIHLANSTLATTLFVISILVWLESTDMELRVMKTMATLIAMCMVAMFTCVVMETRVVAMEMIVCSSLFTASLVLSIVFKLHSLRRQSLQFTKEGLIRISKLPLLGNVCTVVAMVTFCFVSPWQIYYTVYLSTCVLIFLQRDHFILKSHSKMNNLTPTIATAYLILTIATCVYSNVWIAKNWWPWLLGLSELSITIATMPVLHILTTVLWNEMFYISDRAVVFLTPLYSILLLVGTSYTSWLLGTVGLLSGWWLMTYKLPLHR